MKNCPHCKQIMDDFDITCKSCGKMAVMIKPQLSNTPTPGPAETPTATSSMASGAPEPVAKSPLPPPAVKAPASPTTVATDGGGFKPAGQQGSGMNAMDYAATQSLSKPVGLEQMHYVKKQSRSPIALIIVAVLIGIGVFFEYQQHAVSDIIDAYFGPDWVKYTEENYGFSVDFPERPLHDGEDVTIPPGYEMSGTMSVHAFFTETDEDIFMVGVIDYPESWDLGYDDYVLDMFVAGMREGGEGEVVSSKASSFSGYPSVEFEMEADDYKMSGTVFGIDNRIYMITSGFADRYFSSRKADKFIDSFQLIN